MGWSKSEFNIEWNCSIVMTWVMVHLLGEIENSPFTVRDFSGLGGDTDPTAIQRVTVRGYTYPSGGRTDVSGPKPLRLRTPIRPRAWASGPAVKPTLNGNDGSRLLHEERKLYRRISPPTL
jgi:hypothetical protein